MNNSKTATQKHMTLDDRISIEKGLDQHLSLRSIALQLGKDPTTIYTILKVIHLIGFYSDRTQELHIEFIVCHFIQ